MALYLEVSENIGSLESTQNLITIELSAGLGPQGPKGDTGDTGPQGPQGDPGEGVPAGGTTGQIIKKDSSTDYDTSWVDRYVETFNDIGTVSSGTATIDYSNGTFQKLTVGGDIAIAFSNLPTSGTAWGLTLKIVNGAAHTITWPGELITPGAETIEKTASGTDILVFTGHLGSTEIIGATAMEDIQ